MADSAWVDLAPLEARLQETVVPDASAPLRTHLLHVDPQSSGSCLLVSFPIGWERGSGTYSCVEHAVVLDGSIELDGDLWEPGTAFVVPADAPRRRTYSPNGALAVAWFSATPRWTGGESQAQAAPSSAAWAGDLADANAACDEVDAVGRRWRHMPAESNEDNEFLRYSWIH
jgi:hypothetical protein